MYAVLTATLLGGSGGASWLVLCYRTNDTRAVPNDDQVNLIYPKIWSRDDRLTLPATVQAIDQASIQPHVDGYVGAWYVDIGAHVKTGDILARIDAPDLEDQYEHAKADLMQSEADDQLAVFTVQRRNVRRRTKARPPAVEAGPDEEGQSARVLAAQARLQEIQTLRSRKNVASPIAGVVTARRIDIGRLVTAHDVSGPGLFDVAAIDRVRVEVPVPLRDSAGLHEGSGAHLTLPQYPGRSFTGTVRSVLATVADSAHTVLVEATFDNPKEQISPGSYGEISFDLAPDPKRLAVPDTALIFREQGPEVAIARGNIVHLQRITVATDTGDEIEVTDGLSLSDRIVASPPDSIDEGDRINVGNVEPGVVADRDR